MAVIENSTANSLVSGTGDTLDNTLSGGSGKLATS